MNLLLSLKMPEIISAQILENEELLIMNGWGSCEKLSAL
jgi:hypothetical protein